MLFQLLFFIFMFCGPQQHLCHASCKGLKWFDSQNDFHQLMRFREISDWGGFYRESSNEKESQDSSDVSVKTVHIPVTLVVYIRNTYLAIVLETTSV